MLFAIEISFEVGSTIAALGLIVGFLLRLVRLEVRVEQLWTAYLGRGALEAVVRGHGDLNSPFNANAAGHAIVPKSLLNTLQPFYDKCGYRMADKELMVALETKYFDVIVKEFCLPYGYNRAGCLPLIASVLRGGPVQI